MRSAEVPRHLFRALQIAATEEHRVHEERVKLEELDSFPPTLPESEAFGVRAEDAIRQCAEQGEHREVLLGVTAMDRGVDEPGPAIRAEEKVAPPEVTVEQGRTSRWEQVAELVDDPGHRILEPTSEGQLAEPGTVEAGGVGGGRGVDRAGPDPVRPPTPMGKGSAVQHREGASERLLVTGHSLSLFYVGRDQKIALDVHDAGNRGSIEDRGETLESFGFVDGTGTEFDDERLVGGRHHPDRRSQLPGPVDRTDYAGDPRLPVSGHRVATTAAMIVW